MVTLSPRPVLRPDPPARRVPVWRRPAAWYAAFAVYAAAVALFSGRGLDRWWGIWATGGYAVAAALALRPSRGGQRAAIAAAVAGALMAPLVWLATQEPITPDAAVVSRSGALLLHHGSPYLAQATLAHGGWLAYNPYLPVMSVFGLPHALGLPGLAGDPRPWLAIATFLLAFAAFKMTTRRPKAVSPAAHRPAAPWGAFSLAALAVSSPVLAFPLAEGITDPPMIALTCLALALLIRTWRAAAVVLGVACAMKYTAWPALAVCTALVATRQGVRTAAMFTATAVGTALALAVAFAPAVLKSPSALLQNTVAYPLGLTAAKSPAQSPLPGHLLATLGPAGRTAAVALLVCAGLAIAASLFIRPPAYAAAAARRLAVGLALLFALSPATRFGYFCYPLALLGWVAAAKANDPEYRRTNQYRSPPEARPTGRPS